jgi:homoserine kinase
MVSRPTFRATPVTVRVPATSANLGAGFDCLGLALEIYDGYAAQVLDEPGLDVEVAGEGANTIRKDEKNLVIASMNAAFDHMGGRPRGLALRALNAIPHGRGLGSSSSAIIGGLFLARSLVISGSERLTDSDLLALATEIEGHPDNVAAAFYGGATIAWVRQYLFQWIFELWRLPLSPLIQVKWQRRKLERFCQRQFPILMQQ